MDGRAWGDEVADRRFEETTAGMDETDMDGNTPKLGRGGALGAIGGAGSVSVDPLEVPGPQNGAQCVEEACEVMHDAYETAAAREGWETQERSRKLWTDVPEANKATMRAAVAALLKYLDGVS